MLLRRETLSKLAITLGARRRLVFAVVAQLHLDLERAALHDPVHSFLESVETSLTYRNAFVIRTGFPRPPRPQKTSQALACGVVANGVEADGAIVIMVILNSCATPPPRRLSHEQIARGSPQDVLRAARAGKGLRRMLRAED